MRRLVPFQLILLGSLVAAVLIVAWRSPGHGASWLVFVAASVFLALAVWRVILTLVSATPRAQPPDPEDWPRYTVLAALHDEADIVDQLVERLSRIDYPPDRLQGLLVLEAHDHATIAAARAAYRPGWLDILVTPPGAPQTKPRALNYALARTTGELLTVYDAEDAPDPGQLREAAARFAADQGNRLACLQAPLRIRPRPGFIARQFAAE
ncbi:MAG: glycosyltransferase, partial [Brevundimonas sp.]|nr:glycosyltransferase [Brevundimonas sp.]